MMSTPVNSLPVNGNPTTVPSMTQEQDALITDVLQEMEKEMTSNTVVHNPMPAPPRPHPHPHPMPQIAMPPHPHPAMHVAEVGRFAHLWNLANFQKAVAAAAIAYLVLRPEVSGFVLERIAVLQRFAQYEWILRILLLVAVFYFLMMYMD